MIILFEDNPTSPVSECLSASCVGESFKFAAGSANLRKAIQTLNEEVYVYVDVVLDNPETVTTYGELVRTFRRNKSVRIIPIPCIEYYVVQYLHDLGLLDNKYYDLSSRTFDFKSFIDKSFGNVPHSIETFYKALLNTSKYICTRNTKSVKNIGTGTFYRTDCACTQYCRGLCKKSLREKSDLLVSYLPAYPASGELRESLRKQGRSSISISLEEFHQLQRLLYDKMSSDLGLKMKLKI